MGSGNGPASKLAVMVATSSLMTMGSLRCLGPVSQSSPVFVCPSGDELLVFSSDSESKDSLDDCLLRRATRSVEGKLSAPCARTLLSLSLINFLRRTAGSPESRASYILCMS